MVNMDIPWILVSIVVVAVLLAVIAFLALKKGGWKRKVDYRNYFNMGIIWLLSGAVFYLFFDSIIAFWFLAMGVAYTAIGLKNRKKWGRHQAVPSKYRKIVMIAMLIGVIALALGIIAFELMTYGNDGCTASGGTVVTSLCCASVSDFPNTCLIGACGCSPTNSHEVKTCECPEGMCFDGTRCVSG